MQKLRSISYNILDFSYLFLLVFIFEKLVLFELGKESDPNRARVDLTIIINRGYVP